MANIDRVEAKYYQRRDNAFVCELCQQKCFINPGDFGLCGTRRADEDILVANNYGKISSLSVEPIEKVNLYHYKPHSKCFTLGSVGCNMDCKFCKNYSFAKLSLGKKRATFKSPEDIIEMCRDEDVDTIAFTYNEPAVWFEYIMDIAELAPDINLVLQTNCWMNDGPLKELCDVCDAMSVDIKAFDKLAYKALSQGNMTDILMNLLTIKEKGVHLEINYLVIPGINDADDMISAFCQWMKEQLSPDTPIHFSRFHPDYEMTNVPITPIDTLLHCRDIGMECGLNFVYVGNTLLDDADDTICPECGEAVIKRLGYSTHIISLDGGRCATCGRDLNIRR